MAPVAVVFDFDGVLVDSERFHCRTLGEALEERGWRGVEWEEYRDALMGFDDRDAFREALRARGVEASEALVAELVEAKARRFAALAERGEIKALPGAAEWVALCASRRPCGLCSGALRSDVAPVLRGMGLEKAFAAWVTAEEVSKSKPDPECYLLCAARLGADPRRCVAFEDTLDGVRSARAAGLAVVGVRTTLDGAALEAAGAAWSVPGLADMRWNMLEALP